MKIEKAQARDRKLDRKRHGMRVHGKNINLLLRAQEKRDKERERKGTDRKA